MKKLIYKQWDGSQLPFTLDRKEIIDRFMENIIKGMSPNLSMSQMIWEGFSLSGLDFRVMGLDEMLRELQKQKEDLYSKYNLEKAFDRPMNELRQMLSNE